METIIVYLDDAAHAQQQLTPMTAQPGAETGSRTHWVLVACAPRITRHISKFVTHSARQNWRARWAEKLFQQIAPQLTRRGDSVTTVLAEGPLPELTRRLSAEHATTRVLDARRPRFGQDLQPVTADHPIAKTQRWSVPGAILGMGVVLVLAAE